MRKDDPTIQRAIYFIGADNSSELGKILDENPEMMHMPIQRFDGDGYFLLPHFAVTKNAVKCLKLILQMLSERGLTPMNDPNDKGASLVITAITHNELNCFVEIIEEDSDCLYSLDPYGDPPIAYAIESGNVEAFRIIINKTGCCLFQNPTTGDTVAHALVEKRQFGMFCMFLDSCDSSLVVNHNGDTLAHALFKGDNTSSDVEILNFLNKLVHHGADLNEKNNDGDRPYDLAVKRGFPHEVLEFFRVEVENTVTNH